MEAARLSDEAQADQTELPAVEEPAQPQLEPAVESVPPPPAPIPERRVEEVVLCSVGGEVLYEWQSAGMERRAHLLEMLSEKAAFFSKVLPLGHCDRLEIESTEGRILMLLQPDRRLFIRSVPIQPGAPE